MQMMKFIQKGAVELVAEIEEDIVSALRENDGGSRIEKVHPHTWQPQDQNNFKLEDSLDPVEALYYNKAAEKLEASEGSIWISVTALLSVDSIIKTCRNYLLSCDSFLYLMRE